MLDAALDELALLFDELRNLKKKDKPLSKSKDLNFENPVNAPNRLNENLTANVSNQEENLKSQVLPFNSKMPIVTDSNEQKTYPDIKEIAKSVAYEVFDNTQQLNVNADDEIVAYGPLNEQPFCEPHNQDTFNKDFSLNLKTTEIEEASKEKTVLSFSPSSSSSSDEKSSISSKTSKKTDDLVDELALEYLIDKLVYSINFDQLLADMVLFCSPLSKNELK